MRRFFVKSNLKVVFVLVVLLSSCSGEENQEDVKVEDQNVTEKDSEKSILPDEIPIEINYHLVATADTLNWLKSLDSLRLNVLTVLNRVDLTHLYRLDSIVLPDTLLTELDGYCPFPKQLDTLRQIEKMILVSYFAQAFAVYQSGERIRWGAANLGKETTPTPRGLFFTNWKSKKTYSTIDPSWVLEWYFNFMNFDGVSLHEYSLPGYPASHACVRLSRADAHWFYYWADQWILNEDQTIVVYGTPILVYGDYPFQGRKPWLSLAENNKAVTQSKEHLSDEIAPHYDLIVNRQNARKAFEKQKLEKE